MRTLTSQDLVIVELPRHRPSGHEQEGYRPAVVVGVPERLGTPRYPVLVVLPMTTQSGPWAARSPDLYIPFAAGSAGLPQDSVALLEHLRGIDLRRVIRYLGTLTEEEYAPIRAGLRKLFDLPEKAEEPKEKEEVET